METEHDVQTTREQRQASSEDVRVWLANAAHEAHDLSCTTAGAGLATASLGWERLRDDINALLARARKLPK